MIQFVHEGLTRVPVIHDHRAVVCLNPSLTNRLQPKLHPPAGFQVRQGEDKVVFFVPPGLLLCDVVSAIEEEGGEEEEGVFAVFRTLPGHRYSAVVQ